MKKIFASVCVIVMCATMVSCGVDDKKVQNCIGLCQKTRITYLDSAYKDTTNVENHTHDMCKINAYLSYR